MSTLWC